MGVGIVFITCDKLFVTCDKLFIACDSGLAVAERTFGQTPQAFIVARGLASG